MTSPPSLTTYTVASAYGATPEPAPIHAQTTPLALNRSSASPSATNPTNVRNLLGHGMRSLRVACWNIHGNVMLKVRDPEWRTHLRGFDVVALQETWLVDGMESAIPWPPDFVVHASSRPLRTDMRRPGGGVVVLVRNTVPHAACKRLMWPDIVVLDFGTHYFVSSYILPASSPWQTWSDTDPMDRIEEVISFCSAGTKPLLWMGDINARTGSKDSDILTRISNDAVTCARGNALLAFCQQQRLAILNGSEFDSSITRGTWTSYQPMGNAVVDYAIISETMIPLVQSLSIKDIPDYSDHSLLALDLTVQVTAPPPHKPRRPRLPSAQDEFALPVPRDPVTQMEVPPSQLDSLLEQAIAIHRKEGELCSDIYGVCYSSEKPVSVWTDGSALGNGTAEARAGAGVWWGERSRRNRCERVGGRQTNNRGELLAIALAIQDANPRQKLIIHTDSEVAIRTYCYWAESFQDQGWHCANADLIRYEHSYLILDGQHKRLTIDSVVTRHTVSLLECRPAEVEFRWVKGHSDNIGNDGADAEAKRGALIPEDQAYVLPALPLPGWFFDWDYVEDDALDTPKVWTRLPSGPPPPPPIPRGTMPDEDFGEDSHRGRERTRQQQIANLEFLVERSQRHESGFWGVMRDWMDPILAPVTVQAEDMKDNFESRMNPPKITPPHFDTEALEDARRILRAIPRHTTDRSDGEHFSRPFSMADIAWAKRKAKAHANSGAPGMDRTTYRLFTNIPNSALVQLFNTCVDLLDAPHLWLTTVLAAILKRGKDSDNPDSYRLIGMESCLLKMLTLLIDRRLRIWANEVGAIPESQNGFRTGYQTNNNAFILRAAIERAMAEGKTLYVVFLDLSNAFPSTDLPSLWSQLYRMGISGPLYDWLRVLYGRMSYMVRVDGRYSETFMSIIGVLTGDTASPTLWNLFMADLKVPVRPGDIRLAGVAIPDVQHADDCAMWSSAHDDAQHHVTHFDGWISIKGLTASAPKSAAMAFRPPNGPPIDRTPFRLSGGQIPWVELYKYVGTMFGINVRDLFRDHYIAKAQSALRIANVTLAAQSMVGSMPPKEARVLYLARIDNALISGTDLAPDTIEANIKLLEDVQRRFLRRLLHLHDRSMHQVLYSETGIMPIRYRRIILTLRRLRHLVALPVRYAKCAYLDSLDLARQGRRSWILDLVKVLHRVGVTFLIDSDPTVDSVDALIAAVTDACNNWVKEGLNGSPKTWMLHDRVEIGRGNRTDPNPILFRSYLRITTPSHRIAFTHLLLSHHCLAIERLRWKSRYRTYTIPREWRLCRFCQPKGLFCVEDEPHAILRCASDPRLVELREKWWRDPGMDMVRRKYLTEGLDDRDIMRILMRRPEIHNVMGWYIYHVLKTFEGVEMYEPPLSVLTST